ncbi:MAG: GNAT family N-acetyltransferase, partial [Janthinobacterium lividum]
GDLLGLLPLYVYATPTGERQLLLIGAGTSDYLDGLFHAATNAPQLAHQALRFALSEIPIRDTLHLAQLRPASPLLEAVATQDFAAQINVTDAEPCSLIDVAQPLPAKVRANAGRYRRRIETRGVLASTIAVSVVEALENFAHLQQFHQHRWDSRGEVGVLSDSRVQAHHRDTIPALLAAGLLRFFRLTLNGETLGVLYALSDPPTHAQRRLYLYLIGFDVRFAEFSPGTLLLHEVWKYARHEGYSHIDLLRGGEEYKQLWGAHAQPTFTIRGDANRSRQPLPRTEEPQPV